MNNLPTIMAQVKTDIRNVEKLREQRLEERGKVIKVLQQNLGPGPLSYISDWLQNGEVATAFHELDAKYNDASMIGGIAQVTQTLSTMVFDPYSVQFDQFISSFENLCKVLTDAGHPMDEAEKIGKLRSAIERGSKIFNDVLFMCLFMDADYEKMKGIIRTKVNEMNRKDFEKHMIRGFSSQYSSGPDTEHRKRDQDERVQNTRLVEYNHSSRRIPPYRFQGKCNSCGRVGHKASECRARMNINNHQDRRWCSICKRNGHTDQQCWNNKPSMVADEVNNTVRTGRNGQRDATGRGRNSSPRLGPMKYNNNNSGGKYDLKELFKRKVNGLAQVARQADLETVDNLTSRHSKHKSNVTRAMILQHCGAGQHVVRSILSTRHSEDVTESNNDDDESIMRQQVLITEDDDVNDEVQALPSQSLQHKCIYWLDSGATSHMTPCINDLTDYNPNVKGWIAFGDNSTAQFIGTGKLYGMFKETLYVPALKAGLISIPALDKIGYKTVFQKGICKIYDLNNNVYCSGFLEPGNGLYRLQVPMIAKLHHAHMQHTSIHNDVLLIDDDVIMTGNNEAEGKKRRRKIVNIDEVKGQAPTGSRATVLGMNKLELLHQRFGHLGEENIKRALRNKSIIGAGVTYDEIKNMKMRLCPDCMKGRMNAFPLLSSGATDLDLLGPFEHLATDDKGPFSVRTIEHYIRFDLFSWRGSKWIEVKFKKAKTDFYENLKEVIIHKIARGHTVLLLQTDADDKLYDNKEIKAWMIERGITHQISAPHVHAQNGWIERDMQTILNRARTIMIPYNCPLRFWNYAISHAVYLYNRSPNDALQGMTPYERVHGQPPDISNLVAFYAPGLYHLTKEERRGSLSAKAQECRLLGYDDQDIKIIYVPSKHLILRRRNCRFEESNDFTESPALHEDELLRRYPALRQGVSEHEGKTIADHMGFFDDELYFEPESETDEEAYLRSSQVPQLSIEQSSSTMDPNDDHQDSTSDDAILDEAQSSETNVTASAAYTDTYIDRRKDQQRQATSYPSMVLSTTAHSCSLIRTILIEHIAATAGNVQHAPKFLPPNPKSLEEALASPYREHWIKAVDAEISQLVDRGTFVPAGNSGPGAKSKLILQHKFDNQLNLVYKARLVLCGYSQIHGVDYDQTHAPTIAKSTVFILLSVSCFRQMHKRLGDVGNAFLEGKNEHLIYMYWPKCLLPQHSPPVRVQVVNSLYGEKQAARIWHELLSDILIKGMNLHRLASDPCVFVLKAGEHDKESENRVIMVVAVHVDDMLIMADPSVPDIIDVFFTEFRQHVRRVTLYDEFKQYLGLHISFDMSSRLPLSTTCTVSQQLYIEEIIKEYIPDWQPADDDSSYYTAPIAPKHIRTLNDLLRSRHLSVHDDGISNGDDDSVDDSSDASHSKTVGKSRLDGPSFLPLIGKLRHLIDSTRPDLLATISILSSIQHYHDFDTIIWINLLKYLYFSRSRVLYLGGLKNQKPILFGFCDASYTTVGDSKSRLGGCFYISPSCGAISSYSKKDNTVSHSSTEAEIKGIDMAMRNMIHLRQLLAEIGYPQSTPSKLYCDNKSAISLCESFKSNHLIKHINMRVNYIRECINSREIEIHFIPTANNVADILTKLMPTATRFTTLQRMLLQGFSENNNKELFYARSMAMHNQHYSSDITLEYFADPQDM